MSARPAAAQPGAGAAAQPELEQPEPEPEPEPEPLRYRVLASATLREGPDSSAPKVGELKKGAVIDVVERSVNSDGLSVLRTTSSAAGAAGGGWLKATTSKGRSLAERVMNSEPAAGGAGEHGGDAAAAARAAREQRAAAQLRGTSVAGYTLDDAALAALQGLRERLAAKLSAASIAALADTSMPVDDNGTLLRFLSARDFDADKACAALLETLAWRDEFGVDRLVVERWPTIETVRPIPASSLPDAAHCPSRVAGCGGQRQSLTEPRGLGCCCWCAGGGGWESVCGGA